MSNAEQTNDDVDEWRTIKDELIEGYRVRVLELPWVDGTTREDHYHSHFTIQTNRAYLSMADHLHDIENMGLEVDAMDSHQYGNFRLHVNVR